MIAKDAFGDLTEAGGDPRPASKSTVSNAGFDRTVAAPKSRAAVAAVPVTTPVVITFKPKPAFTETARVQKIEGEVLLDVEFTAAGAVRVLGVVRGLGFGLDESAREAASQIRFRPATKDGGPVDVRTIVRILFEISDGGVL